MTDFSSQLLWRRRHTILHRRLRVRLLPRSSGKYVLVYIGFVASPITVPDLEMVQTERAFATNCHARLWQPHQQRFWVPNRLRHS